MHAKRDGKLANSAQNPRLDRLQNFFEPSNAPGSVRLATLVRLRLLAILGQSAAVLFTAFGLNYPLDVPACFALITLSGALNLILFLRFGASFRPRSLFSFAQLAFDCLQLAGLLWFTGGLQNPFAILLLAPVAVSATILPRLGTSLIGLLAILLASLLALSHQPLPWDPALPLELPGLYLVSIWIALVGSVAFVAFYVSQVSSESRKISDALAATELALSHQQSLSALDGLAAAASHELGTPLSTIALAAKELRKDLDPKSVPGGEQFREDLDLIIEQTKRCRAILKRLRGLDQENPDLFQQVRATELVEELARQYETVGVSIQTKSWGDSENEPIVSRHVGFLYGLGNFVENAVQFCETRVQISVSWSRENLEIQIFDDGPGFAPDQLARLGEPYLTTRSENYETEDDDMTGPGGLGLGVFIAKTLLERHGAKVTFANQSDQGHAIVEVIWPRSAA